MGKTKELLDKYNQMDYIYDLEYLEWVAWSNKPHVTHEGEQDNIQ